MARPFKQGLDYFPLDVKLHRDPKVRKLKLNSGYLGVHVYICILMLVYEQGYYMEISKEDLAYLIYEELHGPTLRNVDRITEIIDQLAKSGFIEAQLMTDNVITSKAIQKQWLTSTSRRKNVNKEKYWLLTPLEELDVKKFDESCVLSKYPELDNTDNNLVNDGNNRVSDSKSTQKENKNKKKRDKNDKEDKGVYGYPKLHFITKCLIKNKYIEETDLKILQYNALAEEVVKEFDFDYVLAASEYIISYSKRPGVDIYDKYGFYKEALIRNCELLEARDKRGGSVYGREIDEFFEELLKQRN